MFAFHKYYERLTLYGHSHLTVAQNLVLRRHRAPFTITTCKVIILFHAIYDGLIQDWIRDSNRQ